MFGSIHIVVAEETDVDLTGTALLGTIHHRRESADVGSGPRVRVEGFALCGAVTVASKPPAAASPYAYAWGCTPEAIKDADDFFGRKSSCGEFEFENGREVALKGLSGTERCIRSAGVRPTRPSAALYPVGLRPNGNLLDLAGLQAGRADPNALGGAVHQGAHALDVGVPAALRTPVGVADRHTERGVLPAHLAHCGHGEEASSGNYSSRLWPCSRLSTPRTCAR